MAPIISTQPIKPTDIKYYNRYINTNINLQFPYTGFYQDITFDDVIVINAYSTQNDILEINFNNDSRIILDSETGDYIGDIYDNNIYNVPANLPKYTKTFYIKANEPQTIVIDKQFLFFRMKIRNDNNINDAIRIYSATAFSNQNNVKIVGNIGLPAIVDLSGNLHTKDDNSNKLLTDIYNVLKNQGNSTKGSFNFWNENTITAIDGSNNVSPICDLSSNAIKQLTIFGTIEGRNTIVVQFSNNGTDFFDSQYNYNISRGGDYGFNITATPNYIRLRTLNTTNLIKSFLNYS
jgi:hypothetical protein